MLTTDEVIWAFRYCLGRSPESMDAIKSHSGFATWLDLRNALLGTPEFIASLNSPVITDPWVICRVMNGKRLMWVDLSDRFVSQACRVDDYEPAETSFVRSHLKEGDHFLDIGANIGWFTMLASTIVGKGGRITSFEPRPITLQHLKSSIEINQLEEMVTVHGVGVSDVTGETYLSWQEGTDNPGGSFVSTIALGGNMASQVIRLVSLDSLDIGKVNLVKIDVEGSEYKAMTGAKKLIDQSRPTVLSEINPIALKNVSGRSPDEYLDLFIRRNYRVFIVDGSLTSPQEISAYPPSWPRDLMNVGLIPSERL